MSGSFERERHAVFEASAGTGKTYAIGRIVLNLLGERICQIENLLVVTFTEKATSELKVRLRRDIEQEIDREPSRAAALRGQLDQFDQAAISTIHGFCRRILQEYAADLGQDFAFEFVDDEGIRVAALRDVQRIDWHERYGDRLADVLRQAGYLREKNDAWESEALAIVKSYRPECGHRLLPEPSIDGEDLASELTAFTVSRTIERMQDVKRRRGQMSFDDLIERVAAGLDPDRNPRASEVVADVRRRYRFAIVDEFQDTDPRQWSIFRRLFLDGESPSKLIVVGDPKQAIYGFRGADLPTYLEATREMRVEKSAAEIRLGVNWRSNPELIEGLNRFFGDGAFFPESSGLTYVPVEPPPEEKRRATVVEDTSGRSAITIVDVDGPEGTPASRSRRDYAHFTAREIRRLLDGDSSLRVRDAAGERPLSAGDICILVFRRLEAKVFASALSQVRVPYSQYKSGNVRVTSEARDLRIILEAMEHPDEPRYFTRALLTMFLRATPGDLMARGDQGAGHPARGLFDRWRAFAERRQWSDLFQSILEDTGVLFHDPASPDYDRRVANLKLLVQKLQDAGYRGNLDLYELLESFDSGAADAEGDDDYEPQETDEPRAQIMTIHASKGLEFPVVFLGGGFTAGSHTPIAYRDADGRLTFDVPFLKSKERKGDPRTEFVEKGQADEIRRLLYVALTRAQFKLYVPMMSSKRGSTRNPVTTLVKPALEASGLAGSSGGAVASVILPGDNAGSLPPRTRVASVRPAPAPLKVPLVPTFDDGIANRRIVMESFTSMHRAHLRERANEFGDRPDRRDEVHEAIADPSEVFRGTNFGELVHAIFERLDYGEVRRASDEANLDSGATGRLLDEFVPRYLPKLTARVADDRLAADCRRVLRQMIWRALRTTLTPLGGSLCEVSPADRLDELEFVYPTAPGSETFVKGFMDLVFRWRGTVYLLDWKTNVLPSYDAAGLEAGMREAGYLLQYRLYWEALRRWATPTTMLGGVFYLFVRGLNGVDDSRGVYYVPASEVHAKDGRHG